MPAISPAFANPVFDTQATFRAVMYAMARPGETRAVPSALTPPAPLSPSAAALALTLLDYETPFWLDAALREAADVARWLKFHTGASATAKPEQAAFAFAADPLALPPLDAFSQGTPDFPDRSTTIVLQVAAFSGGSPLILSGPGVEDERLFAPSPLAPGFAAELRANTGRFPCGVDIVFAGPGSVAALPRSTRIEEDR
ncbi:phosphonate C-P lyase system protein PhnH [Rhodomicrobium vannielii ATCC 17100]|uniref:phosphonate C-P lyase system protein PhnH n=1 Tax=Rhodomicrobium vannielii TaxID=1069 RepID=UPI001918318A|nr:phosphonate C-P lyase system protein PhnH [Rhodomicrobium vannielii ATCC 17100]